MSGKLYGIELPEDDDEKAMDEIRGFVQEGTPVTICMDQEEAEDFFRENIKMVERDE